MADTPMQDRAPWEYNPNAVRQIDPKDDEPYFSFDWFWGTRITVTRRGWRRQFMLIGAVYLIVSAILLVVRLYPLGFLSLILGAAHLYSIRWMDENIGNFKMLILFIVGLVTYFVTLAATVLYSV